MVKVCLRDFVQPQNYKFSNSGRYHTHSYSDQSVTFVKILIRMNVRIYSYQQNYTNEYPKIFISIFLTRTNVRISIRIENYTNIRIFVKVLHSNTLTNECLNIFVQTNLTRTNVRIYSQMKNWYERMSEYIFVTNIFEHLNIFVTLWFVCFGYISTFWILFCMG